MMEIMSAQDIINKYLDEEEHIKMVIYVANGHLILNIAYKYEIELSRLDTQEKILGWVIHLSEKNWMNLRYMHRFIELALNEIGEEQNLP